VTCSQWLGRHQRVLAELHAGAAARVPGEDVGGLPAAQRVDAAAGKPHHARPRHALHTRRVRAWRPYGRPHRVLAAKQSPSTVCPFPTPCVCSNFHDGYAGDQRSGWLYDGTEYNNQTGTIVVVINYRLGSFGFAVGTGHAVI
jgi:hypothetical protein